MVLPIIIGVGATVLALSGKALAGTVHRFNRLSPQMIATLNKIRLDGPGDSSLNRLANEPSHIKYLKSRFNNTGFESKMTEREALLVLGIEASEISGLTRDILKLHYRKLMIMNHPDRSGSVYLSQKINQAKDVLDNSYLLKK
ncbi:hypothetical protein METBIDRAFT_39136 [Metschnikowia bicuspidata var. bicuspidata NRRL YB-4993]|uniref:J domain-containing protein n=1 Tax=Metschnikowia bicuspidata var. bicuspidata NRRL YB-4993 TaxID=869754 RepID=A0A1A0HEX3_9ASCO|nr:hypothetical protein METBIDRAFT_39136 [Metschnikowia bicuspidata var. bicuspidata NRRL YB-4993]OBA22525.1 hypothetical protein METBIDRAFT_39136 [Metschnikowia bicuspidata var. bicuspidata NRRL YB-4993]